MTKSESMRWENNIVHIGETSNAYKILIANSERFVLERTMQV
jgi:hypothetical protein